MRKPLIIFVVAMVLVGSTMAQGSWYPKRTGTTPIASDTGSNLEGFIAIQTIPVAETSDDDQIMAAYINAFNNTTKFVLLSNSSQFLAQPDVPRNIIATMNTSTTCALKLTGTDISGAAITENLTWTAETGVKASTKAFKTVTRIDATTTTNTAQAKIGTGDLLGLNTKLATNTVLLAALNDTKEATAPSVTVSSTVLSLNTIDTNTAPGGKVTKVWYIV